MTAREREQARQRRVLEGISERIKNKGNGGTTSEEYVLTYPEELPEAIAPVVKELAEEYASESHLLETNGGDAIARGALWDEYQTLINETLESHKSIDNKNHKIDFTSIRGVGAKIQEKIETLFGGNIAAIGECSVQGLMDMVGIQEAMATEIMYKVRDEGAC